MKKKKRNNTLIIAIGAVLAYLLLFRNKSFAQGNTGGGAGLPYPYTSSCTGNCTTYVGVLANQNITMKITGQSTSISGDYVYNTIGIPIQLQEVSRNATQTEVKESYQGNITGYFTFNNFTDSSATVTGTWRSPDGSRTYNFTLNKA